MLESLSVRLPRLLPKAISWAKEQSGHIVKHGMRLGNTDRFLAQSVGVQQPQHVRIAIVNNMPTPDDSELKGAAIESGLVGPNIVGLAIGYAIWLRKDHVSPRLLSHELRHVHQYERAGGIAAFLPVYLQQVMDYGYFNAPLEIDARDHER